MVKWMDLERPVICAVRERGVSLVYRKAANRTQLTKTLAKGGIVAGVLAPLASHDLRYGAARDTPLAIAAATLTCWWYILVTVVRLLLRVSHLLVVYSCHRSSFVTTRISTVGGIFSSRASFSIVSLRVDSAAINTIEVIRDSVTSQHSVPFPSASLTFKNRKWSACLVRLSGAAANSTRIFLSHSTVHI